jgi:hypothetical protein
VGEDARTEGTGDPVGELAQNKVPTRGKCTAAAASVVHTGPNYYGELGGNTARSTVDAIGAAVARAVSGKLASELDYSSDEDEDGTMVDARKIVDGNRQSGGCGGRLLADGTDEVTAGDQGVAQLQNTPRAVAGAEGSREWAAARQLLREFMQQQLGERIEDVYTRAGGANSAGGGDEQHQRHRQWSRWWERDDKEDDGQTSPFMLKLGQAVASKQPGLHSKLQSMLTLTCACIDARLHDGDGNGILDMAELALALGAE